MKIPKRNVLYIFVITLILIILGAFATVIRQIYVYWDDESTWTTEAKVIFPPASQSLKMSIEGSLVSGQFSVTLPYCQLYSVTRTDETATLHCSLLPSYYILRQAEVPKDWSEKTDVKVVMAKGDKTPSYYLGRIDKSFESVQAFEGLPTPVTIYVSGKSEKPEKSLQNLVTHAQRAFDKQKDPVQVTLSEWRVQALDTATDQQKVEYAKQWQKDVQSELARHLNESAQQKKVAQEYINDMRTLFAYERFECRDLNLCAYKYTQNSAEKFMYYMYGLEFRDKELFAHAVENAEASLYPFTGKPRPTSPGKACPTCTVDWTDFSAYTFPICPIADVVTGKKSQSYEKLFAPFVERYLSQSATIPADEQQALSLLDAYKKGLFTTTNEWSQGAVDAVNASCYYLLKDGVSKHPDLKNRLLTVYTDMVGEYIGRPLEISQKGLNNIIFDGSVYSPYKTSYITDFAVSRFREQTQLTTSVEAAGMYQEWRSFSATLILLYMYNGISN